MHNTYNSTGRAYFISIPVTSIDFFIVFFLAPGGTKGSRDPYVNP